MPEQSRADLKIKFSNGKRPSESDFTDLIDSFINPKDDSLAKDAGKNFVITLGNAPDAPAANAGTLRFSAGKVQFSTGTAWQDVGAGAGIGFQSVGGTPNIAYNAGNVGIGTPAATQPSAKLDVTLGNGEQVKFGNVSVGNSPSPNGFVQFSHITHANATNFAIRQGPAGNVHVNAPLNQKLIVSQGAAQTRLSVIDTGQVVVGADTDISGNKDAFQVNGSAFKTDGSTAWKTVSDARLKKDIRPFVDGLSKLLQINPVHFKYNGLAQTIDNHEQIGILGQEIAQVLPYTVSTASLPFRPNEAPTDMVTFDSNALVYVLINAVKELASKVQELEGKLSSVGGEQ